ncbi:hypothetical protein ABTX15_03270 [Micromonospora sp. NPDC094482]
MTDPSARVRRSVVPVVASTLVNAVPGPLPTAADGTGHRAH